MRTKTEIENELAETVAGIAATNAALHSDPNPNRAQHLGDQLHELTELREKLEAELENLPEQ